jgi:hypothetical protein
MPRAEFELGVPDWGWLNCAVALIPSFCEAWYGFPISVPFNFTVNNTNMAATWIRDGLNTIVVPVRAFCAVDLFNYFINYVNADRDTG